MPDLYGRILEQTERLGITGKELGELLGLKKSPLTDWKNHKSNPTLEQLANILSPDHQELIDTYDKLDRRGQHRVHTIIYEEIDRMNGTPEASASRSVI